MLVFGGVITKIIPRHPGEYPPEVRYFKGSFFWGDHTEPQFRWPWMVTVLRGCFEGQKIYSFITGQPTPRHIPPPRNKGLIAGLIKGNQ